MLPSIPKTTPVNFPLFFEKTNKPAADPWHLKMEVAD